MEFAMAVCNTLSLPLPLSLVIGQACKHLREDTSWYIREHLLLPYITHFGGFSKTVVRIL